jgi:hypothetical protein
LISFTFCQSNNQNDNTGNNDNDTNAYSDPSNYTDQNNDNNNNGYSPNNGNGYSQNNGNGYSPNNGNGQSDYSLASPQNTLQVPNSQSQNQGGRSRQSNVGGGNFGGRSKQRSNGGGMGNLGGHSRQQNNFNGGMNGRSRSPNLLSSQMRNMHSAIPQLLNTHGGQQGRNSRPLQQLAKGLMNQRSGHQTSQLKNSRSSP